MVSADSGGQLGHARADLVLADDGPELRTPLIALRHDGLLD
jgi:hypothetical protein